MSFFPETATTTRRARSGTGTSTGVLDVDAAAQAHGLAVTGGHVSHTGVAGLTLGGGIGHLMRKLGLTADHLKSAEIVTSDGRVLRASASENPDLFWAIRGGGGNFGIATEFVFGLTPVGPTVMGGLAFWAPDKGPELNTRHPGLPEVALSRRSERRGDPGHPRRNGRDAAGTLAAVPDPDGWCRLPRAG
jgi:hypothetical protein